MYKNLKTLAKEAKGLHSYVKRKLPSEVSQRWLWEAQNAFLAEQDPESGVKWADRYGVAFGKGLRKTGNVERYLSYKKLHRTGRLLRSLKVRRKLQQTGIEITLYSRVPYAKDHNEGGQTSGTVVKAPYVTGGASGVITGGRVVARPFMYPSRGVLRSPSRLLQEKMRKLGW